MGRDWKELHSLQQARDKFVCVGLDSDIKKIPVPILTEAMVKEKDNQFWFNTKIVDATCDIAGYYKPNFAFYAKYGSDGLKALRETVKYINTTSPQTPVILDSKYGDIGNTNEGYVEMAFEYIRADAVTVSPYMGGESLKPFFDIEDKGIFVLCRTSNPGAGEFQDLWVSKTQVYGGPDDVVFKMFEYVAYQFSRKWNTKRNCGLVVGATYPHELRLVRGIVGNMPILIPGIGAQGGDLEETVKAGKDSRRKGIIINSSRGIIFAQNPREETIKLNARIKQFLSPNQKQV